MTTRSGWKLVAMATLGSALALTACAPSGADSSGGGGSASKKTLTVWSWRVEDEAAYNKIFDLYEKSHEGITVNFWLETGSPSAVHITVADSAGAVSRQVTADVRQGLNRVVIPFVRTPCVYVRIPMCFAVSLSESNGEKRRGSVMPSAWLP